MNTRNFTIFLVAAVPLTVLAGASPACAPPAASEPSEVQLPTEQQEAGAVDSSTSKPMPGPGQGVTKMPPDFPVDGKTAIFVEITGSQATLSIDVAAKKASVKSHMDIDIHQPRGGSPVLDVVPATARFVTVDKGQRVALATVSSPDKASTMRMVDATLTPGKHTLDFQEYALNAGKAANKTFAEGIDFTNGFEFLTDHDDLLPRFFTERYFPAGFECHRYPFVLTVDVQNAAATQKPDVMTNGKKEVSADGRTFKIDFPVNDSTSAWFMHVVDLSVYKVATGAYKSMDGRTIPLSAHAKKQADADLTIADMKVFFQELEADYGPYPHASLLASVGGVNDPEEYDGAVQTDLDATQKTPVERGALGHEILHQWFGRSARPLTGRDGWVDEGIAQWRDNAYPRPTKITEAGKYVPLAVASPYQRQTPDEAYDQGAEIMMELDFLLKDRGGLKPVLKAFHERYRDTLYTTEMFLDFVRQSAPDLKAQMMPIFVKKVYAGAAQP